LDFRFWILNDLLFLSKVPDPEAGCAETPQQSEVARETRPFAGI
jgi:hypothetical protein